jgi:hypothetical protein
MAIDPKFTDPDKIEFDEADFTLLMQKRIRTVLLICSSYDAFMLDEDGRIEEQIFSEYVSLNLRQPPGFIHAHTAREAFSILETESVDLVIEMLSIPDVDPFELARQIKLKYSQIPIVALTHFSREVSLKLKDEDLTSLDYVFCWLGNANLLLSIIKLIEDSMNVEFDTAHAGVPSILLVEDSIRFTSVYLPELYKTVFVQSHEFLKEALNDQQRRLRMRGRPKILLAKTYDEALVYYHKYKNNLLGIISDICIKESSFKKKKIRGGEQLCKMVKKDFPFMPFVFQSSDKGNSRFAERYNVGFIHKFSKTLSTDLEKYVAENFGFGDFIFRNPVTHSEIARASDLVSFHRLIKNVPDDSLIYHSSKNEISKWLFARSVFPVAQIFKSINPEDFSTLSEIKDYLFKAIGNYRLSRAKGVIANFHRDTYDEYQVINRIGEASVGGKARGLVFLSSLLKRYNIEGTFPGVKITIPRSVVLTTEIFEEFIDTNCLYNLSLSDIPDNEILENFLNANLPARLDEDLLTFIRYIKNPIAVRSSSKLEDSQYQPFAGIYSTYMVPVSSNPEETLTYISRAIKAVYASVFYKSSKAYMAATSNVIDDEKMGIILQEVCGCSYGNKFYPTVSGVARSLNFYPIPPEKGNDGIVNLGFGLGKYVVDGGITLKFSPKHPNNILQLSSVNMALKDTQKQFYALDLSLQNFIPTVEDSANLLKLKISEAENDGTLNFVASTYDYENNMVRDGIMFPGKRIITFGNILQHKTFPLPEILDTILEICQHEMNNPVEIEFAVNLDVQGKKLPEVELLQVRPIVFNDQRITFTTEQFKNEDLLLKSSMALGNGYFENIFDIVYVKPETFKASANCEIALSMEYINNKFIKENKNYILAGPGRWGSSDAWLGIPVKWPQISEARIIIETDLKNYKIDPSQGTHFFQNLTSFHVGYISVNADDMNNFLNFDFLSDFPTFFEDQYIRHIRFNKAINAIIDGRNNTGIILKPGIKF